jgi:hypothetical protein
MDIVIYQDVPMDLCPNFKTHIGYMFISATDLSALNLLYEEYVGLFDNIVDFRDILT